MQRTTGIGASPPAAAGDLVPAQVRSGSAGGLAGFANNGRLQQWGSPERNNNGISRQTSVTSMGSGMPMVSDGLWCLWWCV